MGIAAHRVVGDDGGDGEGEAEFETPPQRHVQEGARSQAMVVIGELRAGWGIALEAAFEEQPD